MFVVKPNMRGLYNTGGEVAVALQEPCNIQDIS